MSKHSLADLLAKNTDYLTLTANNKVRCSLTEHEMPCNADVVFSYMNGKKFKKAKEWYSYDYSEFLPHIVPDKRNAHKLFCRLTKQSLNKIPDEVRKHIAGKKYLRLKGEHEMKKKKKVETKEEEDLDIWVPPDDLLNEDDDDEDDMGNSAGSDSAEPMVIAKKKHPGSTKAGVKKVVEEDTLSDLIGSDHDDDEMLVDDGDDDDAFDFDAVAGDGAEVEEADEDNDAVNKAAKKAAVGQKRKPSTSIKSSKSNKLRKQQQ